MPYIETSAKDGINIEELFDKSLDKFLIGINFKNDPKTFTTIGQANPILINIDCLEKNPEFFRENINKRIIPIINSEYEYIVCI